MPYTLHDFNLETERMYNVSTWQHQDWPLWSDISSHSSDKAVKDKGLVCINPNAKSLGGFGNLIMTFLGVQVLAMGLGLYSNINHPMITGLFDHPAGIPWTTYKNGEINGGKHAGKNPIKHIKCEYLSKPNQQSVLHSGHPYLGINGVACLSASLNQHTVRAYFSDIMKDKLNFTLEPYQLAVTKRDLLRTLLGQAHGLQVDAPPDLKSSAEEVLESILEDNEKKEEEREKEKKEKGKKGAGGKGSDDRRSKEEEASRRIDDLLNSTLANSTGPLRSGDSVCRSIASWLMSKPKQAYIDAANRYKSDHIYQCKSRTKVDVAIQYRSPDQNHENGDHLNCTMKCTRALLATVQQQNRARYGSQALCIYVTSNDRKDIQDLVDSIQTEFRQVEFLALVREREKEVNGDVNGNTVAIPHHHSGQALMQTRGEEELPMANITIHTDLLDWFLIGEATHAVTSGTTFDGTARLRLPSTDLGTKDPYPGVYKPGAGARIHYNIDRSIRNGEKKKGCACRDRNRDEKWCL